MLFPSRVCCGGGGEDAIPSWCDEGRGGERWGGLFIQWIVIHLSGVERSGPEHPIQKGSKSQPQAALLSLLLHLDALHTMTLLPSSPLLSSHLVSHQPSFLPLQFLLFSPSSPFLNFSLSISLFTFCLPVFPTFATLPHFFSTFHTFPSHFIALLATFP